MDILKLAAEKLDALLEGRAVGAGDMPETTAPEALALTERVSRLTVYYDEIAAAVLKLSQGDLGGIRFSPDNVLAFPIKELHSRLMHLTWQTQQIASGDYGQRVDFMGEFSGAFNAMVEALDRNEKALKQKIKELEEALARVKRLERLLPICMHCKKIRPDSMDHSNPGSWKELDLHVREKTDTEFSHSICPQCMQLHYPDIPPDE